jgi:CRISPR-associated protein Cas2
MRDMLFVFAYDIADDRVRRRVAALLEKWGTRVQDSVFEVRCTRARAEALLVALDRLRLAGDGVRMYALPEDARAASQQVGGAPIGEATEFWLL